MAEIAIQVIVVGGNITLAVKKNIYESFVLKPADLELIKASVMVRANPAHEGSGVLPGRDDDKLLLRESDLLGQRVKVDFFDLRETLTITERTDSSSISPELWVKLAKAIRDDQNGPDRDRHDGFVVLHGLDTMAYTASALSFMLGDLRVSVILTGSQRPLNFSRTDAIQNIICAITLAAERQTGNKNFVAKIPEVCVFSHDTLFRGNRVRLAAPSSYRPFDSPNFLPLAEIGDYIDVAHESTLQRDDDAQTYSTVSGADVRILDVYPGIDGDVIDNLFPPKRASKAEDEKLEGLLLRTYGMGTAPTGDTFLKELRRIVDEQVAVLTVTQSHTAHVSLPRDPVSLRLFQQGVLFGADMTSEAAYAKMCVLLSNAEGDTKPEKVANAKRQLQRRLRGEQSRSLHVLHFLGDNQTRELLPDELPRCVMSLEDRSVWNDVTKGQHGGQAIREMQLRVFGLACVKEAGNPIIKVFLVDEQAPLGGTEQDLPLAQEKFEWRRSEFIDDNKVFDVSEFEASIINRKTCIRIESDLEVKWSRLDLLVVTS